MRWRHAVSHLGGAFAVVIGVSVITFVFLRAVPGDPARLIAGPLASPELLQQTREDLGLDDPLAVQYVGYVRDFIAGDWGFSFSTGQPARDSLVDSLPASIELAIVAFTWSAVASVLVAVSVTYKRRRVVDVLVRLCTIVALGTPRFWLGLVLLLALSNQGMGIFPGPEGRLSPGTEPASEVTGLYTVDALISGQWATFWDAAVHLMLPAFALGFTIFGYLTRLLRANLLDLAQEPYLLTVKSKGVGRWQAFVRHALPNAMLPTLTAAALIFAQLLAGSVLVEAIFSWPGAGQLVVDAALSQDFAVVQAFILLSAISYVILNALTDLLYGVVDPRVRRPTVMK